MSEREQPPTDSGPGLPEDGQPGTGMDPTEHAENESPTDDAPKRKQRDGDAGQATGNPRAAGADDD